MRRIVDIKVVMTLIGALGGLIGVYFAWRDYRAQQPHIHVGVASVSLQTSDDFDMSFVISRLNTIEESYGEVTGYHIVNLRDVALTGLDPEAPEFEEQLQTFGGELQKAIKTFDATVTSEWRPDDIGYENGVLTWPDGNRLDVLNDPLADIYLSDELVEAVREGAATLGPSTLRELKQAAYELYGAEDDMPMRRRVSAELRKLRTSLEDAIQKKGRRIRVAVSLENRSRLPTVVKDVGLLCLYNASQSDEVILEAAQPVILEGYSVTAITFESQPLETLDESQREFIEHAARNDYGCFFFVQDLHTKIWYGPGNFLAVRRKKIGADMAKYAEEILKEVATNR